MNAKSTPKEKARAIVDDWTEIDAPTMERDIAKALIETRKRALEEAAAAVDDVSISGASAAIRIRALKERQ